MDSKEKEIKPDKVDHTKLTDEELLIELCRAWPLLVSQARSGLYVLKRTGVFLARNCEATNVHLQEIAKVMAIEKTKADRYKQDQMTEFVQTLLNLQSALQEFSQQQQMFTQKVLEIVVNPFADFHKQGELVIKNLVAEEQKITPQYVATYGIVKRQKNECLKHWTLLLAAYKERKIANALLDIAPDEKARKSASKKLEKALKKEASRRKTVQKVWSKFDALLDVGLKHQAKYYNSTMKHLLKSIHGLEMSRLSLLENGLRTYATLQHDYMRFCEQVFNRLGMSVGYLNANREFRMWLQNEVSKLDEDSRPLRLTYDLPCSSADLTSGMWSSAADLWLSGGHLASVPSDSKDDSSCEESDSASDGDASVSDIGRPNSISTISLTSVGVADSAVAPCLSPIQPAVPFAIVDDDVSDAEESGSVPASPAIDSLSLQPLAVPSSRSPSQSSPVLGPAPSSWLAVPAQPPLCRPPSGNASPGVPSPTSRSATPGAVVPQQRGSIFGTLSSPKAEKPLFLSGMELRGQGFLDLLQEGSGRQWSKKYFCVDYDACVVKCYRTSGSGSSTTLNSSGMLPPFPQAQDDQPVVCDEINLRGATFLRHGWKDYGKMFAFGIQERICLPGSRYVGAGHVMRHRRLGALRDTESSDTDTHPASEEAEPLRTVVVAAESQQVLEDWLLALSQCRLLSDVSSQAKSVVADESKHEIARPVVCESIPWDLISCVDKDYWVILKRLLGPTPLLPRQLVPFAASAQHDQLAKALVQVSDLAGCLLPVLRVCFEIEIDRTESEGTIFRTDSVATKMWAYFANSEAHRYLQLTLKTGIKRCLSRQTSFEINPVVISIPTVADDRAVHFISSHSSFLSVAATTSDQTIPVFRRGFSVAFGSFG